MRESEMHEFVAKKLGIDLQRVIEYDKLHWRELKIDLNNPTFDIMEVPFLGSFTMTKPKLRSTLRYHLRILKRVRNKLKKGDNPKLEKEFEASKKYFYNLWQLRKILK